MFRRAVLAFLFLTTTLAAQERREVDVELVLAVDVSRSMTPEEMEIQRRGYAEALLSEEVLAAIADGLIGEIALTYVEWAGPASQRVVVDWMTIRSRSDARAFVSELEAHFELPLRRTSISGALDFAANSIEANAFHGLRRVIDISGDGPNNEGPPVLEARAAALARGITVNGLPLMTRSGPYERWNIPDLDVYYLNCVIGGPGAFSIPVHDWPQFADAVRRKLVLEIAGVAPERLYRAQAAPSYDCLIGEKIWQRNLPYATDP